VTFKTTFRLFALIFVAAAAYHLLALAPGFSIPGTHWRHALFVAIDFLFAGLLLLRPRWLVFPFLVLTVHSLYSHGSHAWMWWRSERRVDWLSLGVVIIMPIMLAVLIVERRKRNSFAP
jgi:hypothetical protein